jgi:hypothetical protein
MPKQFKVTSQNRHPVYDSVAGWNDPGHSTYFQECFMRVADKRSLMISGGWIQAAAIVLIIGYFIMAVAA